jgi:hypothetical protein
MRSTLGALRCRWSHGKGGFIAAEYDITRRSGLLVLMSGERDKELDGVEALEVVFVESHPDLPRDVDQEDA